MRNAAAIPDRRPAPGLTTDREKVPSGFRTPQRPARDLGDPLPY
jgi:hypothetical protein